MKVIVRTETKLCSGTWTNAYIPKEGCENATEQAYIDALNRLYMADLKWLGNLVTESNLDYEGDSYIYGGDYSMCYKVLDVELA